MRLRVTFALLLLTLVTIGCHGRRAKSAGESDQVVVLPSRGPAASFHLEVASSEIPRGGEPEIEFILKNTSSQSLWVNSRMVLNDEAQPPEFRDVWLRVQGPDGLGVPYDCASNVGFAKREDYALLKPGDVVRRDLRLRCFTFATSGIYVLKAWYRDGGNAPPAPAGAVYFGQEIDTEKVTVRVVPQMQ
jgi:hypothetical protein